MKRIPLTQGASVAVDDKDYKRLKKYKWYKAGVSPKGQAYAARKAPKPGGGQKMVYMHRVIAGPAENVDHLSGNKMDNQRKNLKPTSHAKNMKNLRKRKG